MTAAALPRSAAARELRASLQRLRAAMPVTFVVHVTLTLFALIPATVTLNAFLTEGGHHPYGMTGWLDHAAGLELLAYLTRGHGLYLVLQAIAIVGATAIVGVPLQLAWLFALNGEPGVFKATRCGLQRIPAALGVSALSLIPLLAAVGLLAALPATVSALIGSTNPQHHDVAVALSLLPGVAMLALWATWHDIARAAVVHGSSAWAAMMRARRGLLGSTIGYAILKLLALALLIAGHQALMRLVPVLGLLISQSIALAITLLRALWLALASERLRIPAPSNTTSQKPSTAPRTT